MSLQLILGGSGSGKTHALYEELIRQASLHPDRRYLLLVPEQFSLEAQKELVGMHPGHGVLNIDVLSFARLAWLVFDELGVRPGVILDDLGKSMLLKKTAVSRAGELAVYGRQAGRMGFTGQIKSTLSEFYQYRIHPEKLDRLTEAARESGGSMLACKLRDISVLFRAFEEALGEETIPSEELLEILCRCMDRSRLIAGSTVALDGYTGFTPVQYEVIAGLLRHSPRVIVTVTVDPGASPYREIGNQDLFSLSRTTIRRLEELAGRENAGRERDVAVAGRPARRFAGSPRLDWLEEHFFRYPVRPFAGESGKEEIRLYAAGERRGELEYVCREILRLVRDEGYRYREIAVLTGDMAGFADAAGQSFDAAGIPYFMDSKKSMLANPLVELIRSCLEVIRSDFSYESVFRFAKCGFGPLAGEELYSLENYVIALGIRGASRWEAEWDRTYRGEEFLNTEEINGARRKLAGPLLSLRTALRDREKTCAEKLDALEEWLEQSGAAERVREMGREVEAAGEPRLALEYAQIPDAAAELFGRVRGLMGEERMTVDELAQILDAGFEEMRIGSVPPCVDRVTVGDLERTRLGNVRAVFLIGFNEGVIPASGSRGGLLTEYEREQLKDMGAELAPTAKEQGFIERFYLYLALTRASDRLYLTWSERGDDGRAALPSAYLSAVRRLFPDLEVCREERESEPGGEGCWEAVTDRASGLRLIADGLRACREEEPGKDWQELYSSYWADGTERPKVKKLLAAAFGSRGEERIGGEISRALYGEEISGSVSRLEKYAACAYSQFLTYGLRLQERQEYEFAAVDMGNLFHQALESCFARLRAEDRTAASLEDGERRRLVSECVREIAEKYGNTVLGSTARNRYLTERIERITERTLWAVGEQTARGRMEPTEFELDFSARTDPAMRISLDGGARMNLRGRIDRIDTGKDGDTCYLRVVDYKSGAEAFDLSRIYHGLQLQLIVYLEAATDREKKKRPGEQVKPAGAYYFHIGDPLIDSDVPLDPEAAGEKILEKLRLDGLTLADSAAVRIQDREFTGTSAVIPVTEKNGAIVFGRPGMAGSRQFARLAEHVRRKLAEFGGGIAEGEIAVNPYRLKERCACDFCAFSSVCGFDARLPGCRYRRLSPMESGDVWEALEREDMPDKAEENPPDGAEQNTGKGGGDGEGSLDA